MQQNIRILPPIHQLQNDIRFMKLLDTYHFDQKRLTSIIQHILDEIRSEILHDRWKEELQTRDEIIDFIFQRTSQACFKMTDYSLKRVINATGTILHTNLGRARLSEQAVKHVVEVAENYSNLEYNLDEATRGSRHNIVESLLKQITGAEAAMVVNNNAAAVYLILRAFAKDKEVIVSRGQLVEIGGSFRISAIMEESGASLLEVGTTNKTHLFDYENAITEKTAMILKVHTSNFKTIGFTHSVSTEELTTLVSQYENIIYYEDLGSGVLYDLKEKGIGEEPLVSDVLQKGADIVSFSGDKLLGGPQAGIIVGKKIFIDQLKKHQLARVLRVDKMTLAALEATLLPYLQNDEVVREIPVLRDILAPVEEIKKRGERFITLLHKCDTSFEAVLDKDVSIIGGGTMPDVTLPTYAVLVSYPELSADVITSKLRNQTPSIITRVRQNFVLLDFRAIQEDEINLLVQAFRNLI